MSYNNSRVGEFIEPEGRTQKKDNLNIIDGKHSVYSMIDTRAFGSNVVLNIEGAPMISYSKGAESKKVFGEISPTNKVSLTDSDISGKLYMDNSGISYSEPYTTFIGEPIIKGDDKERLAYVTNMRFDPDNLDNPTIEYEHESINLPYITVIGRSLDSYANKHNGKRITDPFTFGIDSTIKVKVLIDVEDNTSKLNIPFIVPKIPVYAKITTGIYSSIESSITKPRVLLPLPHLQFPMVAYMGNEAIEDEAIEDVAMFHSGRCFFENTSNDRVSAATCGYYPVSSDLIGKTLRDEYETEPESGLLTHTHISHIDGHRIERFGDFVAMHNGIIKEFELDEYKEIDEDEEPQDIMSFGVRDNLYGAIESLFESNKDALAYEALLKNDFAWSGTKMFTGQKVFKDTIIIDPTSNTKPYLEIEYRVVTINKAQNSIGDPEDDKRFSYAAEQMVSLIPLNASVRVHDGDSWTSNDLPEIVTNMRVINPPNSICDADRNVAVATSSEDIKAITISAESILLFAMPDMSDKIIGIASELHYSKAIVKNAIIPIFELDEVSITSNEYIFLPDYYSLRVNTFSILAYDDYEKVVTFEIEIDEYEDEERETLISTQKKTYCCSLYHYDNYPMTQLSATGVLNSYLMTTKRVPDQAVVKHNVDVEVPSNFVHNSFKFSSVKGESEEAVNFRRYGRYSLYQDYEETQGDTTFGEELIGGEGEFIGGVGAYVRYHSYHKKSSSNAGFTYKGQAMIDFFVGNSQFSDKITTNSIDFSIGNSSLLTLRSFYSNAASVYSTGNGIKTYRDVEIIPLVYPVPFFMKNNSKETTACVSYCGARNDSYMYGRPVEWSPDLHDYLYSSPYFRAGNRWKRNFLSNIEINPEVYSQISSHMHAIDIQRPHLSGGSFCSIELLDYAFENLPNELNNFFGISSVTGSLIVSKTPKVIEGGALETIDDVTGVLGIDMTRGSLIASNNEVVINENRYLLFNGKIYKPSNYFQKMSTTSNEEVNSLVSGESSLSIPPFIFINRGNSYGVYYSSRDTFSLTFNGIGELIDTPIKHEKNIFFGDVNRGTLNIYAIGESSVNNIFSSNIKKMYNKVSPNEKSNDVDIISIKMISPETTSQPMCLVKLKEEGVDPFNVNIFLYPSGVSFSDGIDYNYIIIPTVYGEASAPLFVNEKHTLMEMIETDATSESEFTIESSKIDIHDNGVGIFVPLALELYYTQVEEAVYSNGTITNNNVYYEILCDDKSTGTIIQDGKSRAIPNTKNKLVCEFTLDKNLYDSFYFKLRGKGIKIRNISIVGYYVEKN